MLAAGYSLYFENAAVRVLEHPGGFAIVQYKPGSRSFADLQAAVTHAGNLLRRRGWRKLLTDQRDMTPFTVEEKAWVMDYWQTYIRQQGYGLHAAVLRAHDVFARLSSSQLRHDNMAIGLAIDYRQFETEALALAWLTEFSPLT